ncbi:MBL fold metallo-hydrolase [Arcticibacter eurypsychrophilus]|uniref:MBL fold metallo-hydrolase n=1 Tax=Arcticibacter eurypsychrophilus TaxID=1434752 RepID=UPI00084D277C|nr:MBL fold metallo-hydrolase [Arcticibacter eurypsychrophilus]
MKLNLLSSLVLCSITFLASAQQPSDKIKTNTGPLTISPVQHASLVITWNNKTIYVDPTGTAATYKNFKAPDLILITDIHPDHLDPKIIDTLNTSKALFIVPQAVADLLPGVEAEKITVLNNGNEATKLDIKITAIPMYNIPETPDSRHPKGRGNGYILNIGGKNIYISGDTGDTKEMRALKNIDVAFVCMNLPYTMDINHAASGVLAFKPAIIYPYHHKGQDIKAFKKLVNDKNPKIEVRLRNWYPN